METVETLEDGNRDKEQEVIEVMEETRARLHAKYNHSTVWNKTPCICLHKDRLSHLYTI